MSNLRHFYKTDLRGNPIPGSNINVHRKPITFGAGQKYTEFVSVAESLPCCTTGDLTITSIGKKWRYYVRLKDDTNQPIAGSLIKAKFKPGSYAFQEVVGKHQCANVAQWNATYTWSTTSPKTLNLANLLNLSSDYYSFVASSGSTDDGYMTYTLNTAGSLVITQVNSAVRHTDTITLQYTNGTCNFAFQMTLEFSV